MHSIFHFSAMFSRLVVKFMDDTFLASKLVDSITLIDFFAKVGGICSLFIGASLISFVELLYYLTLRLFFAYRSNQ